MGVYADLLAQMSDEVLEQCRHVGWTDGFDWESVVKQLRVIRRVGLDLDATPEEELPDAIRNQALQLFQQTVNTVHQIEAFDYQADPNAHNTRTSLANDVQGIYNQMRESYRLHARPPMPAESELSEIRALVPRLREGAEATQFSRESVEQQQAEVADLMTDVRDMVARLTDAAAASAGHTLSKHYKEARIKHEKAAYIWLTATVAVLIGLGLVAYFAFDGIDVSKKVSDTHFARDAISRLFFLGLIGYGLTICARGYRAQTHLAIVCQQKANALDTFPLFQETVNTDAGKEAVTAELVRAVFATSDSGYLDASADKTIVEQQGAALTSLLAARRG